MAVVQRFKPGGRRLRGSTGAPAQPVPGTPTGSPHSHPRRCRTSRRIVVQHLPPSPATRSYTHETALIQHQHVVSGRRADRDPPEVFVFVSYQPVNFPALVSAQIERDDAVPGTRDQEEQPAGLVQPAHGIRDVPGALLADIQRGAADGLDARALRPAHDELAPAPQPGAPARQLQSPPLADHGTALHASARHAEHPQPLYHHAAEGSARTASRPLVGGLS